MLTWSQAVVKMPAPLQTSYLIVDKLLNLSEPPDNHRYLTLWEGLTQPFSEWSGSLLGPSNQWVWRHSKARTAPWWPQSMGRPEAPLHGSSQLGLNCCFPSVPYLALSCQ